MKTSKLSKARETASLLLLIGWESGASFLNQSQREEHAWVALTTKGEQVPLRCRVENHNLGYFTACFEVTQLLLLNIWFYAYFLETAPQVTMIWGVNDKCYSDPRHYLSQKVLRRSTAYLSGAHQVSDQSPSQHCKCVGIKLAGWRDCGGSRWEEMTRSTDTEGAAHKVNHYGKKKKGQNALTGKWTRTDYSVPVSSTETHDGPQSSMLVLRLRAGYLIKIQPLFNKTAS